MINLVCVSCSKTLTGKQRLFCSEACRKRFDRSKNSPVRELSGNGPVSSGFVRKSSANVREFSNKRTFDVKLLIIFESDLPPGEWDNGLINAGVREKIAEIAQEWLNYEYQEWKIIVKVR